jgi:hypothetical protein
VHELCAICETIALSGGNFAVAMTAGEKLRFLREIRIDHGLYRNMIATVNAETSECSIPSDRESIHEGIRNGVGFSVLNHMIVNGIEVWMREALHAQAATTLEAGDELEAMTWNHVLANVLHDQGLLYKAMVLKQRVLAAYRTLLPKNDPQIREPHMC